MMCKNHAALPASEAALTTDDLNDEFYIGNALRGLIRAKL